MGNDRVNRPFFVGNYPLSIDAKNRLSIPHPIRSKMDASTHGRSFYVVPGRRPGILAVYPDLYFEQTRKEIPPEEQLSEDAHAWRQFELSQSALIDPDSQGRILLPERLLKKTGITKTVTLTGAQDHLEIWDRAEYEQFEAALWDKFPEARKGAMTEYRELGIHAESGPVAAE